MSAMAAILTVVFSYAVIRVVQLKMVPEPNPALVTASAKIAMFWRLTLGAYAGALVGVGVHVLVRRHPDFAIRALGAFVLVAAGAIALQGIFVP